MNAVSVKLPAELRAKLVGEARRRNLGLSTLVREILERALPAGGGGAPSCLDLAGDIAGSIDSGRTNAATDRRLLEQATLRDARRAAADRHR